MRAAVSARRASRTCTWTSAPRVAARVISRAPPPPIAARTPAGRAIRRSWRRSPACCSMRATTPARATPSTRSLAIDRARCSAIASRATSISSTSAGRMPSSRFRYVSASDPDRVQAGYGQLMFWLAQTRAGVAKPRVRGSARRVKAGRSRCCCTCAANTPKRSSSTRSEEGDDDATPAEHQHRRAAVRSAVLRGRGLLGARRAEVARDYFAALVNSRCIYFLEHGLALAEIAKLRELKARAT